MGFWKGLGYIGGGILAVVAAPVVAPVAAVVAAEAAVVGILTTTGAALTAKGISTITSD